MNLTVVIQCAGTKSAAAGHLMSKNGHQVKFVAHPRVAPESALMSYRHPDDPASSGLSWRQELVKYNRDLKDNPCSLLPAWRLYVPRAYPRVYLDLVDSYGLENVFILSAGWGLVAAKFLLPNYDITFAAGAECYKRRRKCDRYEDFAMHPTNKDRPVVFLGGKDYVPLFCSLTKNAGYRRIVFHYTRNPPRAMNCELHQFKDAPPRTWHYECASALIRGEIRVGG